MTSQPIPEGSSKGNAGEDPKGDEIIDVVRETVHQLELLTGRLKSFIDPEHHMEEN